MTLFEGRNKKCPVLNGAKVGREVVEGMGGGLIFILPAFLFVLLIHEVAVLMFVRLFTWNPIITKIS
jgi:hypothetical protein